MFYLLKDLQKIRDGNSLEGSLSKEARNEMVWWKSNEVLEGGRAFAECDQTVYLKESLSSYTLCALNFILTALIFMFDVHGSSDAVPTHFGFKLFSKKFASFSLSKAGKVQNINRVLFKNGRATLTTELAEQHIGYAELFAVYRGFQ